MFTVVFLLCFSERWPRLNRCYASMMGPVRKYQQGTLGCEEMCGVIKRRRLHAIGQLHLKRWFETTQAGKVVRSLLNKMAMA